MADSIKARQKIDFTLLGDSFLRAVNQYNGFDGLLMDTAAWCSIFRKQLLPDIEIYLDVIMRELYKYLRENDEYSENMYRHWLTTFLTEMVVHELIHYDSNTSNEYLVSNAVRAILSEKPEDAFMVWGFIPCPRLHRDVTWAECLSCEDDIKESVCPLLKIRQDAFPRTDRPNEYHVSELQFLRQSYYGRRLPYSKSWNDYWSWFFGKAVGYYVASLFGTKQGEVSLRLEYDDIDENDLVFNTGHVDVLDDRIGILYEFKCYKTLTYIVADGKPDKRHEWQARAYYTMAKKSRPDLLRNLKKVMVVYFGRTGKLQYKEFEVPMEEVDLWTPTSILHHSLKNAKPPKQLCDAPWLCKSYCDYRGICKKEQKAGY